MSKAPKKNLKEVKEVEVKEVKDAHLSELTSKVSSLEATLAEKNNIIVFLASLILSIEGKVNELEFLRSPKKLNLLTILRHAPKIIELVIFVIEKLKSFRENVIINEEPKNEG